MKSLKAQLRELPRPAPAEAPAAPAPVPAPDFKTLFRDVKPIKDTHVWFTPPRPSPHPRHRRIAADPARIDHAVGWFEPPELAATFVRSGMQSGTLKRLRALHWPVCAELDLHGLDRYQAQDRMALFLHQARRFGNCVRIIHGRGIGSQGEPVLKRLTRTWLAHHPDVLAFCDANDGGALIVLLRRQTD